MDFHFFYDVPDVISINSYTYQLLIPMHFYFLSIQSYIIII